MSRYIDADALRDKLYEVDAVTMRGVAIINNEPTVDAVQAVRCKDCKWSISCGYISTRSYAEWKDWFCAEGERRTECNKP